MTAKPIMATGNNSLLTSSLAITPTLTIVAEMGRTRLSPMMDLLIPILREAGAMPTVGREFYAFNNDQADTIDSLDSFASLEKHIAQFIHKGSHPIRNYLTSVIGTGLFAPDDKVTEFSNTTKMSIGSSIFPDDPIALSISIHSTAASGWEWLETLRQYISRSLGASYLYSFLGYGFACHIQQYRTSILDMQNLCMRYLGADLDDMLGTFNDFSTRGLRTINWQVEIAKARLSDWTGIDIRALLEGATSREENWLWKTAPNPSRCDRNNPDDWASISAYATLDRQLKPLMFLPDFKPAVQGWHKDTVGRWRDRWTEVSNAVGFR
jgi:hypothetical protein